MSIHSLENQIQSFFDKSADVNVNIILSAPLRAFQG